MLLNAWQGFYFVVCINAQPMKYLKALLLVICISPLISNAQDDEMETDRPSESLTPKVVVKNRLQVEVGVQKEFDKTNGQKEEQYLYPTALIKFGLAKKLEVRMLLEDEGDYEYMPDKQKQANGLKPVKVAFKYNLLEAKGCMPDVSLVAGTALPKLASPDFKGDYVAPYFRFAMENSLTKKLSLVYNVGVQWQTDDVHAQYLYTLSPQLELSKNIKVFAEVYGFLSGEESADHRFDAGILYKLMKNLQIDIYGGAGITKTSPDSFIAVGLSFRLPR